MKRQRKAKRRRIPARVLPDITILENTALGAYILQFVYVNNLQNDDNFNREVPPNFERRIQIARRRFTVINVQFSIVLELRRITNPNETIEWHHTNRSVEVTSRTNIMNLIHNQMDDLSVAAQNANLEGSDWVISHTKSLKVNNINNPRRTGGTYIEAPKIISDKKELNLISKTKIITSASNSVY
jgi:hypothetical protein